MNDIIRTVELTFSYEGEGDVLKGVSTAIAEGCFCAVIGHNGSGKSTFARHLNAINLPCGGKVYIDDMDTANEENIFDIRSRAGMVFQNPDNQMVAALVEDEAAFAPENLGIAPEEIRKRVDEALKTVGMSQYALTPTANLSGGQKQRVAIAGVLAMKPKIIIMDEATAMLDPVGRHEVLSAIKRINRENGTTVIFITHYMEEAAQADRILVMDGGRVVMDAEPAKIFSRADELKSMGLDVPQITQTARALKSAGINIRADILSEDELFKEIVNIYDKNRECKLHI